MSRKSKDAATILSAESDLLPESERAPTGGTMRPTTGPWSIRISWPFGHEPSSLDTQLAESLIDKIDSAMSAKGVSRAVVTSTVVAWKRATLHGQNAKVGGAIIGASLVIKTAHGVLRGVVAGM